MKHKIYMQYISLFSGVMLIVCGVVMAFKKLSTAGVIDIKSAVFSGKIETGSLGLLFCFLGVAIIVTVVSAKIKIDQHIKFKKDDEEIDWSKSETGDPYWVIREEVFTNEKDPTGVEELPFCDWPDEKITEMVNDNILNKLFTTAQSYLAFHDRRTQNEKELLSKSVINTLRTVVDNGSDGKIKSNIFDRTKLEQSLIDETFYFLESSVSDYFIIKKRIFVGWDKYPNCYPPIHKYYEKILIDCENHWNEIIKKFKKSLNAKRPNEQEINRLV